MRRLKTAIVMMVLALWMPVTSHCLLENIGAIELDCCCAGMDTDLGHCHTPADNTCQIELGHFRLPTEEPITQFQFCQLLALHPTLNAQDLPKAKVDAPAPEASPPELARTWQFAHRAALPVRAPTI